MPTKRELERMLAEGEFEEDDDDDDQVSLTLPSGHSFTGSYRRARKVAAAHGMKLEPDPEPEPDDKTAGKGGKVTPAHFGGTRTRRSS